MRPGLERRLRRLARLGEPASPLGPTIFLLTLGQILFAAFILQSLAGPASAADVLLLLSPAILGALLFLPRFLGRGGSG